jgi:hypothetical protein
MPVLSESQEQILARLAAPLPRSERERFRKLVLDLLAPYSEWGDGLVNRAAAAAQHEVMTVPPPRAHLGSKWGRRAGAE